MVANCEASPDSKGGKRLYHLIEKATKCCGRVFQSFIHSALEKLSHGYDDNEGSLAHVHLLIFYLLFFLLFFNHRLVMYHPKLNFLRPQRFLWRQFLYKATSLEQIYSNTYAPPTHAFLNLGTLEHRPLHYTDEN